MAPAVIADRDALCKYCNEAIVLSPKVLTINGKMIPCERKDGKLIPHNCAARPFSNNNQRRPVLTTTSTTNSNDAFLRHLADGLISGINNQLCDFQLVLIETTRTKEAANKNDAR